MHDLQPVLVGSQILNCQSQPTSDAGVTDHILHLEETIALLEQVQSDLLGYDLQTADG